MSSGVTDVSQSTAVLLTVFNRPEQTRRTVEALLRERPARIYVSGDGPRSHVATDAAQVDAVWDVVHAAPWECEVLEHRSAENLGCGVSVRGALDWFFAAEPSGCVLEDDVELGPGALALAAAMLELGQSRADVGSISLLNTVPREHLSDAGASFRQSRYLSSWGWGSWADAWAQSPRSLTDWRAWLPEERLHELGGAQFAARWAGIFDSDEGRNPQIWDYTWQAYLWSTSPVTFVSNVNLVLNNGFTQDATYTLSRPAWVPAAVGQWSPPLVEPSRRGFDESADEWESRHRYGISRTTGLRNSIASRVPGLVERYRRLRYGAPES